MDLDPRHLDRMLAEGEAQLQALRNGMAFGNGPELEARLAALEARVDEQQQVLRHTLTMLIEWIEGQSEQGES